MARESLVAVSYPVNDEFTRINTGVLDGAARVVLLQGRPEDEVRALLSGNAARIYGFDLDKLDAVAATLPLEACQV